MNNNLEILISKQTLITAFANADFGSITKRDIVRYALLKVACGFRNGHTSQSIINELGLCTKKLSLTKKGKEYLHEAFTFPVNK